MKYQNGNPNLCSFYKQINDYKNPKTWTKIDDLLKKKRRVEFVK
jgi:hypothetical protein